jgi:tetratricopeptide (TPR) repeat protein
MKYISNAIQLRRYLADNYGDRAKIFIATGEHDKALEDLRHGYKLKSTNKYIIDGLTNTYFSLNQYDSTVFYARKRLAIDSSGANYYYMVAKSYLMRRDIINGKLYTDRFQRFNQPSQVFRQKLDELTEIINRFE